MRGRSRTLAVALAVASFGVAAVVPVAPAQAAPTWCKAWQVRGETWYGHQTGGFSLMFTLRMVGRIVTGWARFNRGDPNRGGVPSQFLRGGMNSDGVGHLILNIVWTNGTSGQYHGTPVDIRRTPSGGLTAGLRGTTVQTAGGTGSARWWADGLGAGIGGTGGRYLWPLSCLTRDVVRYP